MPTRILGLSAYYHDSAACLVEDGRIVAAAQEERFTRKKHDAGFPSNAVAFCLREAGITAKEIDLVDPFERQPGSVAIQAETQRAPVVDRQPLAALGLV